MTDLAHETTAEYAKRMMVGDYRIGSYGLRHKTTRDWLTKDGTLTRNPDDAQPFANDEEADAIRQAEFPDFSDCWLIETLPPLRGA